ncbi:hypothetical protein GOV05_04500 [Candidatus Woesearchaeota archaeon]|nr:hypothetical protein [Candidatus Woesearchaeota archaeon]
MGKQNERFLYFRTTNFIMPSYQKKVMQKAIDKIIDRYETHLGETHTHIDVTKHKGRLNKGKTRRVDMFFVKAKIKSDAGLFIASAEEYGLSPTTNEVERMLEKQIRNTLQKIRDKYKTKPGINGFAIKASV